ncbi:hypothetical protein [Microvirga yunnanensis]|uniref:hypothetical protein n=1 Tax=Microvirga yunnanensis TaxID=2953740 RepID=UPI0021C65638|nr:MULTISPECIES: hypothetical protein [unclassified Microvirga]
MTTRLEHLPPRSEAGSLPCYPPDLLPQLQSLLAALADIDFAHERELETIRSRPCDGGLKHALTDQLQEHHEKRRAPLAHELESLQERIAAIFR